MIEQDFSPHQPYTRLANEFERIVAEFADDPNAAKDKMIQAARHILPADQIPDDIEDRFARYYYETLDFVENIKSRKQREGSESVLQEQLEKGEISEEEYRRKKRELMRLDLDLPEGDSSDKFFDFEMSDFFEQSIRRSAWRLVQDIGAPPKVLYALVEDFVQRQLQSFELFDNPDDDYEDMHDRLLENIEFEEIQNHAEQYAIPKKKTAEAVHKLSKGFALAADHMSALFKDMYMSREFHDVLTHPDQPSPRHPMHVVSAYDFFMFTIEPYVPWDFWGKSEELLKALDSGEASEVALNEENLQDVNPVRLLLALQKTMRIAPQIADVLKDSGYHNLATMADCFARKAKATFDNAVRLIEIQLDQSEAPKPPPEVVI